MSAGSGEVVVIKDAWEYTRVRAMTAWSRTTRRVRIALGGLVVFILALVLVQPAVPTAPRVTLDYGPEKLNEGLFNERKVALLIENRPFPLLSPLILHFMSVVPPDWRFRFMGSPASVEHVNASHAIRDAVDIGKLDLTYIPSNMTTGSQEEISQFLTTLWLYETVLQPAEWLLVFQTDSMLCSNSRQSLNDWLEYDWVGAPWDPNGRFGGNGGLSLRKVSSIIDVLRYQKREPHSEPEDVWLTERLGHRPNAKMADGTASLTFSGEMNSGKLVQISDESADDEDSLNRNSGKDGKLIKGIDDWRDGFYEPMGYHTGGSGDTLHSAIWGKPENRKHMWDYCPEMKMTLRMDVERYVPGNCNNEWKRDEGYETEIIDGVEYPLIPAGLLGW